MDADHTLAARALAVGDPLGALRHVALRTEPPALALRGIAMAQLGEFARAKRLLQRAAKGFGSADALARARCEVARAEVELAARDLVPGADDRVLARAWATLERYGDRANASYATLVMARRDLLLGRVERAASRLAEVDAAGMPAATMTLRWLVASELATLSMQIGEARAALERSFECARASGITALVREIEARQATLDAPAARWVQSSEETLLSLAEVEAVLASPDLVVDGCRRWVRRGHQQVHLERRPVLFALALALAEASPREVTRDALIERAFGFGRVNETHRARLRVEISRLRRSLSAFAEITATKAGFVLRPRVGKAVALVALVPGDGAAVLALLADGRPWSTSSLALALGQSQRTVQRLLSALEEESRVRSIGQARAKRWLITPTPHFATALLLPLRSWIG